MNKNPTPKAEFLALPSLVKSHHELLEHPALQVGISTALQEMQRRASAGTKPSDFNECAASHLRMLGAHDFIDIFLNLGETMSPGVRSDTTNLPGNVSSMPGRKN